jgi:benzodiazapine receptor
MALSPRAIPAFLLILFGAILSSLVMNVNSSWYKNLPKPKYNPPNYLFGIVWPILYILFWLTYILSDPADNTITTLFVIVAVLLALWSPVFFLFQSPALGSLVLITLIVFSIAYAIVIIRKSTLAFVLFIPFLIWITFATYLNLSIAMNKKEENL